MIDDRRMMEIMFDNIYAGGANTVVQFGYKGAVDTSKLTAAEIESLYGEGSEATALCLFMNGLRPTRYIRRELKATDWFDGSERATR